MGITGEFCRKQVFTGELEPAAFVRMALAPETIEHLASEEMRKIIDAYQVELNIRG